MFTGIVTHIGTIENLLEQQNQDLLITIKLKDQDLNRDLIHGCSISCSGACLTLTKKTHQNGHFYLDFTASKETVDKTNISGWSIGHQINLEFALKVGDELGGHLVSGHVDEVAVIKSIKKIANSHQLTLEIPSKLTKFICQKGSVTLDGISLTVNDVKDNYFEVNIIEHTFNNTALQYIKIGDKVNLEIDIIARYLNRLIKN